MAAQNNGKQLHFAKMHGTGNDFIVVDLIGPLPPSAPVLTDQDIASMGTNFILPTSYL